MIPLRNVTEEESEDRRQGVEVKECRGLDSQDTPTTIGYPTLPTVITNGGNQTRINGGSDL